MSKIPPQRIPALNKLFELLFQYHGCCGYVKRVAKVRINARLQMETTSPSTLAEALPFDKRCKPPELARSMDRTAMVAPFFPAGRSLPLALFNFLHQL